MSKLAKQFTFLATCCVLALALAAFAGSAQAEDPISRFFSPTVGQLKTRIAYEGFYHPTQDLERQDTDLSIVTQDLSVITPIAQDKKSEWGFGAWVSNRFCQTDAVMPYSGKEFPETLWDMGVGLHHKRKINPRWIVGAFAGVGSASDDPFHSSDAASVRAAGMASYRTSPSQAWNFYIFYSNLIAFWGGIPVPGVSWMYTPSKNFRLNLGVPAVSIFYRPIEKLSFQARYAFPNETYARLGYDLTKETMLYTAFAWTHNGYFRKDRKYDDDRLFFFEKRVSLGLTSQFSSNIKLEAAGGWAFDRLIFEGENYSDRDQNRLDIEDGMFFKLLVGYSF
jgi:hypothetical protein